MDIKIAATENKPSGHVNALHSSPMIESEKTGIVEDISSISSRRDPNGNLGRYISPWHIHIIALGSSVGSGLFVQTGKALALGGPGSMVLAYIFVCTGAWANLHTLSEMTIAFPVSGNFVDYAGRWVDPSLAFAAGFCEWLGWTCVLAAEAQFTVLLINYWNHVVPDAALRRSSCIKSGTNAKTRVQYQSSSPSRCWFSSYRARSSPGSKQSAPPLRSSSSSWPSS
jgi:amino acid permease